MSEVDFVPFAPAANANVLTQQQYLADPQTAVGVQPGLARSAQANKAWRQATFVASAIAYFIAEQLNIDVLDDGNLAEFVANLTNAVQTAPAATLGWFRRQVVVTTGGYAASAADNATLFASLSPSGSTVALPNPATINVGWYCGLIHTGQFIQAVVSVSGNIILVPRQGATSVVTTATDAGESLVITYIGNGEFLVISASPNTWAALGASSSIPNSGLVGGNGVNFLPVVVGPGLELVGGVLSSVAGTTIPAAPLVGGNGTVLTPVYPGTGLTLTGNVLSVSSSQGMIGVGIGTLGTTTFTIPAATLKVTLVGGGAGGSATFGGGSGASSIQYLTNLIPGATLTVTIGAGGGPGADGGATAVNSGSQSIQLLEVGGGNSSVGGPGVVFSAPYTGLSSNGSQGTEVAFFGGSNSIASGGSGGFLGSYGNGGQAGNPGGASPGVQGVVMFEWFQ